MKIVHVVRQYAPSVGGLEDAVANLCQHLARQPDVQVSVVTLDRLFSNPGQRLPARETMNGIDVRRIPFFGSFRYPLAFSVLGAVKDADIVHVHAIDFFFDFLAGTKLFHRKTLVASTHGGFFHTSFAARLKKIYFQSVTRLSCLAYSRLCASSDNDALTFGKIAKGKVTTIENGVNIEKWADAGSPTPQRTMIFIGRWAENKRVPLLFDLLAELKKRNPAWRLAVAGVADRETRASLSSRAREKGVESSVVFFEKPDDAHIRALLAGVSYIVSASAYEGFGLTVIEGLSAGLVPVLSPLPPFQKIMRQMGLDLYIDPDNLEASARRIEDGHGAFAKDPEALRKKGMLLSQKYAWSEAALRVLDVYKEALMKKGR